MKIGYKGAAIALIALGGLLVAAYQLGTQRGNEPATASTGDAVAGELKPGAAMPSNHPSIQSVSLSDNNPFVHFRVGNRNVKSIFADDGIVWIGTSGGVIRYDVAADKYKLFDNQSGLLSNGVFHVSRLGKRILVGTYGGGLSVYDPDADAWRNYNIPDGLADQFVYDAQQARNGDLWIATWSGVNRVRGGNLEDPTQWESFTVDNTNGGLPNPWVYALEEGKNGEMWFATEYGLARYKDDKWDHWQHPDGLGASFEQVRNDIQFTSDPSQASSHHAQQKVEQGLEGVNVAYNPNYIISLAVTNDGMVWCGTWGAGLARFDGKNWHNFTVKDGLPANHIFMLYKGPDGQLWAGTSRGLAKLNADGKSFTVRGTRDGLFSDNVFSMAYAQDGSLWVGSFGGVAHINRL